jgi:hypothetical protein
MSDAVRPWLPKTALHQGALAAALAAPLAAWSGRWFARSVASVSRVRARENTTPPRIPQGLQLRGRNTVIDLSGPGKKQLLEAALDADLREASRGESDLRVLETFAGAIIDDLLDALDAAMSAGDGDRPAMTVTLSLGKGDLLDITIPETTAIALVKGRAAPARSSGRALQSRTRALRASAFRARATLGSATLALSELKDLAVGDVLVLDRSLNDRAELRAEGASEAFARGALRRQAGRYSIQL